MLSSITKKLVGFLGSIFVGRSGKTSFIEALIMALNVGLRLKEELSAEMPADQKAAAVDEFYKTLDDLTGLTGVDLVKTLPPEAEEELCDGVIAVGRVLTKWSLGVYGKYDPAETAQVFRQLTNLIQEAAPISQERPPSPLDSDPGTGEKMVDTERLYSQVSDIIRRPSAYTVEQKCVILARSVLALKTS